MLVHSIQLFWLPSTQLKLKQHLHPSVLLLVFLLLPLRGMAFLALQPIFTTIATLPPVIRRRPLLQEQEQEQQQALVVLEHMMVQACEHQDLEAEEKLVQTLLARAVLARM